MRSVGIEQVDGVGECIVLEYVTGQTLDQVQGSRADRRRWFEQLVEAVGYIHSQQVVHSDLKPQNIIVTDNGHNVKLIDFGLADADNFAELKQPAGTLRYVSPEQQNGGNADVRIILLHYYTPPRVHWLYSRRCHSYTDLISVAFRTISL